LVDQSEIAKSPPALYGCIHRALIGATADVGLMVSSEPIRDPLLHGERSLVRTQARPSRQAAGSL
jgi:hypothetical protein